MSHIEHIKDTRNCSLKLQNISSDKLEDVCDTVNIPTLVTQEQDDDHYSDQCNYQIGKFIKSAICGKVLARTLESEEFQQSLLNEYIENNNISNSSYANDSYIPTDECLGMIHMHEEMCNFDAENTRSVYGFIIAMSALACVGIVYKLAEYYISHKEDSFFPVITNM